MNTFGELTLGQVVLYIAACLFLYKCYSAVRDYFVQKAISDNKREEQINQVIAQASNFPTWHEQSLKIQKEYNNAFDNINKRLDSQQEQLDRIEKQNIKKDRDQLRDRIIQSFNYYMSPIKNPMKAWTDTEAHAFWELVDSYTSKGGNGDVHSRIIPCMRTLEEIPMSDEDRRAELMHSRK